MGSSPSARGKKMRQNLSSVLWYTLRLAQGNAGSFLHFGFSFGLNIKDRPKVPCDAPRIMKDGWEGPPQAGHQCLPNELLVGVWSRYGAGSLAELPGFIVDGFNQVPRSF